MTHPARIKIAAAVVVLFLAALSAAGLLSHALAPGAGISGQAPSAVHAPSAPAQTRSQAFQYEGHD